jgi:hypothetical protein
MVQELTPRVRWEWSNRVPDLIERSGLPQSLEFKSSDEVVSSVLDFVESARDPQIGHTFTRLMYRHSAQMGQG